MLLQRILVVVLLVPLVLALLFSPWPFLFKLFVQICVAGGLMEHFKLNHFSPLEIRWGVFWGCAHGLFLQFVPFSGGVLLMEVAFLVMTTFLFYLLFFEDPAHGEGRLGLMLLGFFYIGTLGPILGLIRDFYNGATWVFLLFALTWLNDTFAYFGGHWWGRRKLAPRVSPGKTVEGFLFGFVGSLLGLLLVYALFGEILPWQSGLVLTLLAGFLGPLGDLSESLLKRSTGVKDSGRLIPGHGGVLDRVDALLFVAPVVYGFALYSN